MHTNKNINQDNNLAEQVYWDNSYSNLDFHSIPNDDMVRKWIEEYIPQTRSATCFEIGCFPGRYLSVFGELGYELNGIDLTPRVTADLPKWLQQCNYKTGIFEQTDFFKYSPQKKFDLVCSFGFIEHFKNWEEVLKTHAALLAQNGYLVIETPNFKGWFQRLIHLMLDKENYKRHYIPSMDPFKWKKILEPLGFEIIFCDYLGSFQFWVDQPPQSYFKKKLFNQLITHTPRLQKLKKNKKAYSPYCGLIAKKL